MSSKTAAHNATIGALSNILKNTRIKGPQHSLVLEKQLKGVANHWRIDILRLVANQQGITLDKISETLNCNFKTTSSHTQKLVQAGLLQKKYLGQYVLHSLSPQGRVLYAFLQSF